MKTIPLLRTPLAATDYAGAVAQATAWAARGDAARCIAAANTHVVTLARREPAFAGTLSHFDLILPDGVPLVWVMNRALRRAGEPPLGDRVYGPTFMLRCLEATQGEPWRHLLIGGTEELLAALREKLAARFPDLRIAGTHAPPFGEWSAADDARILDVIRASRAQFVWLGLGCPKQERWLARHKAALPPGVYSAVGAAFAFHAGRVRQAPPWVQRLGLEWLFRLLAEPRRLWRRYVVFNTLFLAYLAQDALHPRRAV